MSAAFVSRLEYNRLAAELERLRIENEELRWRLDETGDAWILQTRLRLTPFEAAVALELYKAGRPVSRQRLHDLDTPTRKGCRGEFPGKGIDIAVHNIRNKLGREAVVTVYTVGFVFSPAGRALVQETLTGREAA